MQAKNQILAIAFVLVVALPAAAGTITLNEFKQFALSSAGTPATGCDPADPAGPFCIPSSGTPTTFLDAPPWTFTAPVVTVLEVVDAFQSGDRFQVLDFGSVLGLTSTPTANTNCGDDPVVCLATPGISSGAFTLPAGNHSVTIIPTAAPSSGGTGYLRASTVPEPGTWILLGAGLILLSLRRTGRLLTRAVQKRGRLLTHAVLLACLTTLGGVWLTQDPAAAQVYVAATRFAGPTSSQPAGAHGRRLLHGGCQPG